MLLLRSYLFLPVWIATGIITGTVSLLLWPLPYRWGYNIIMLWNRFVVWWAGFCCGVHYRVVGKRPFTAEPCVILSNHQSTWETVFLQYYFGPASTILKKELLRIPFFGWGLALLRPVAIDRSNPVQALKRVKSLGKARLKDGNNLLVFPEGTRMAPGQSGRYARSGADIACSAGVPVVPVAHNAGTCWPGRSLLKYPGTITVIIGEPIATQGRTSREVMEEARTWIEDQVAAIGRSPKHAAQCTAQSGPPGKL
ncbi:MAG: lysophospholipid acyltransferase family protein [Pseudomonadales bacterium]|nr:1-acyl-sn-glycerol-3-phosphate acyltransferase [Pseudomonadales bacterium]